MAPRFESTTHHPFSNDDDDEYDNSNSALMPSTMLNKPPSSPNSNIIKSDTSSNNIHDKHQNLTIDRHIPPAILEHSQHYPIYPPINLPLMPLTSGNALSSSISGYSKHYGDNGGIYNPPFGSHTTNPASYIPSHSTHGQPGPPHHSHPQLHQPVYQGRHPPKYSHSSTIGISGPLPNSAPPKGLFVIILYLGRIDSLFSALQSEYDFILKENTHFRKQSEEMELKSKY